MRVLLNIGRLLMLGLETARRQIMAVSVIVVGIFCAVAVLVSMLSLGGGIRKVTAERTKADHVIVTSSSASSLLDSSIERADASTIENMPAIQRDGHGRSMSSPVAILMVDVLSHAGTWASNIPLSGVVEKYFELFPDIRVTSGRMFREGHNELIIREIEQRQFQGLNIGDYLTIGGAPWTIVGQFTSESAAVGPALADANVLLSAVHANAYQYVVAQLTSPSALAQFRNYLREGSNIDVNPRPERVVMQEITRNVVGILDFVSFFVGAILAVGATIGAVASVYSIVDGRQKDIGTLRALGFSGSAVALALVCEVVLYAAPAALLGIVFAWVCFNNHHVSPMDTSITLAVTPCVAMTGIVWALLMGIVGAAIPAVAIARAPVVSALRTN